MHGVYVKILIEFCIVYITIYLQPPTAYKDIVIYSGIYTLPLPWTVLYILK
jgi:hypothetical protein